MSAFIMRGFYLFCSPPGNAKVIRTVRNDPREDLTVAAIALLGLLISEYSAAQTVRCTTWNLEWSRNGLEKETPAALQEQRTKKAADVFRRINPDKQQVAILSKSQAQAAWVETWKSMNGVDPPRGFA